VFLCASQRPELVVPLGLQRGSDQAVVGVDPQVTALGQVGFVAGPLDLLAAEPVGFFGSGGELVLDGQCHLQSAGAHALHQQVADGPVEGAADDPLAGRFCPLDALPLAAVLGHGLAPTSVIADGHAPTATPADGETLEEGWSFPGRAVAAVGAIGGGVGPQLGQVLLVFAPGDVTGVGVEDECVPLLSG